MARIRTIKPEFWTDPSIVECSTNARLLLLGLLNFADDYGGIEFSAKMIKALVFPCDSFKVDHLLEELIKHNLIIPYENVLHPGKKYLYIKGFTKHQRIDRPGKPRCPFYEDSTRIRRTIDEDSTGEGKGREGKGRDIKTDRSKVPFEQDRKFFEEVWESYPWKRGKEKAWLKFKVQVDTVQKFNDIKKAVQNYIADVEQIRDNGQADLNYQNGSTWFNHNWKDYVKGVPGAEAEDSFDRIARERRQAREQGRDPDEVGE